MPTRTNAARKAYIAHVKSLPKDLDCEFCLLDKSYDQFIRGTKSFKVIKNLFPYSSWDFTRTEDHIMIVPKRHIDRLAGLTASEMVEFMDLIGSYEIKGYNVYARAPQSGNKTIVHQHTHLIKPVGRIHKFMFYLERPYIRIFK